MLDTARVKDSVYLASAIGNFTGVGGVIDNLRGVEPIAPPDPVFPSRVAIPRSSFRLAGWSRDNVRVAWLASDSIPMPNTSAPMTRFEVATFNGRSWTDRERVTLAADGQDFFVPAHRAGRPWNSRAFAVLVSPKGAARYVAVLAQRKSRWIVAKVDSGGWPFAPSLAELQDGTLVLTSLAEFHDVRGWYSRRGAVRNERIEWEAPVLIDRVPGGVSPYSWAQLGADSLMLVWHREQSDTSEAGARVVLSADGGKTWNVQRADALAGSSGGKIRLAVDVTGTPRLMFMTDGNDRVLGSPGRLALSSWVNGRWTTPAPISSDETDTSQQLWALADGTLLGIWTKIRLLPSRSIAPTTFATVGRPRCGG
jgi:hypothetical protein